MNLLCSAGIITLTHYDLIFFGQELRVALMIHKAALRFSDGMNYEALKFA